MKTNPYNACALGLANALRLVPRTFWVLLLPLFLLNGCSPFEAGREAARRGEGLGVMGVFGLICLALFLFAFVAYCRSLRAALYRCSPENRAMYPELIWLLLLPVIGVLWHFVVVLLVHKSLTAETSGSKEQERLLSARKKGIAASILPLFVWIPFLGFIGGVVALLLWLGYWSEISMIAREIQRPKANEMPCDK